MTVRRPALALAVALTAVLAACGDDGSSSGSGGGTTTSAAAGDDYSANADPGSGTTIVAKDFSLTSVTVAPGAAVKIENEGSAPHTVTADDGAFDSGRVSSGSSSSITAPAEPGSYAFHCEVHPSMTGTLTVAG